MVDGEVYAVEPCPRREIVRAWRGAGVGRRCSSRRSRTPASASCKLGTSRRTPLPESRAGRVRRRRRRRSHSPRRSTECPRRPRRRAPSTSRSLNARRRSVLGAVLGIQLGDRQRADARIAQHLGEGGERVVLAEAGIAPGVLRQRRVGEVDAVDVEVHGQAIARGERGERRARGCARIGGDVGPRRPARGRGARSPRARAACCAACRGRAARSDRPRAAARAARTRAARASRSARRACARRPSSRARRPARCRAC